MPTGIGQNSIATSCVPYGDSFAIVGGTGSSGTRDTVAWYDPATETFITLPDHLSQPKSYVTAFAVNEKIFPPCQ